MAKLLFIQDIEYKYLGPMYISAMVKRNHDCRLVTGRLESDFLKYVESYKPDVVGFSIMTGSHSWALKTARYLKSQYDVITLFGGAHPTFFPDFINEEGVDIICRGEGEEAVLELLDRIDSGRDLKDIENLCIKSDGVIHRNEIRHLRNDLDFYPSPDRSLYVSGNLNSDTSVENIITSRGCPFSCTFCFEESMRELYKGRGNYVRIRKIEKVIAELYDLKKNNRVKTIYFCDDVFGINKNWLYSFLEEYRREISLEFVCLVRADIVCSDENYARKLRDAGCRNVFFGIETGSELLRNRILNKRLKNSEIYKAGEFLHKAGIKFRTYNILGLPDETLGDMFDTVKMNINLKADFPWCSIFTPYPGTALAEYAIKKGYLGDEFNVNNISRSFFVDSCLKLKHKKKAENMHKFFQTAVLWPWTLPFVKLLINLPPNILFKLWFGLIYFYLYLKSEKRSFIKNVVFALRNYKYLLIKG